MLLVEQHQSVHLGGIPLYLSMAAADESLGLEPILPAEQDATAPPPEIVTAAQNDASLAQLTGMLGGLKLG